MAASETTSERPPRSAELAVVGGGVIGLACAWRAAEIGLETTVVDAGGASPAAATVAAGMLAPTGEAVWGEEPLLRLNLAAAERWPGFARQLADAAELEVPYRRCGALHVALDRDEAAQLRRRFELQRELELEAGWLRGSECRRLEPGLATAVAGGIEAPGEAEVDPRALLAALRRACERRGVRFLAAEVEEIVCAAGSPSGLRLAGGEQLAAERVLIAAGAWSGRLLDGRSRLPVRPVAGEIVRLRAARGREPCERIVVSERAYLVPRASGELVVGATTVERGFDARVTAGGIHELLREAYRVVPEVAELELVETAAGLRPGSPDNAPLIGRAERQGVLVATGHHRNGILQAPITAEAIERLLEGAPPPPELAGFDPGRFAADPAEALT